MREDELALHLREGGEAWTLAGDGTAWQRGITFGAPAEGATRAATETAAAMKHLREACAVLHGLRKNALIMLDAGYTEKEVEKVVCMSTQTVEQYAI